MVLPPSVPRLRPAGLLPSLSSPLLLTALLAAASAPLQAQQDLQAPPAAASAAPATPSVLTPAPAVATPAPSVRAPSPSPLAPVPSVLTPVPSVLTPVPATTPASAAHGGAPLGPGANANEGAATLAPATATSAANDPGVTTSPEAPAATPPRLPPAAAVPPAPAAEAPARPEARRPATATPTGTTPSVLTPAGPAVPAPVAVPTTLPPAAPVNSTEDGSLTFAPGLSGTARDDLVRDARAAFGRHDRARLAALRAEALASRHPLAPWFDYWELTTRLNEVSSPEVEAFYQRWPGSYVEDRLRNDWLLELGHRRDLSTLAAQYPRFRMNDDREVTCYVLAAQLQAGHDPRELRDAARAAWMAQKDGDDGCQFLAQSLYDAHAFTDDDVWRRLRQAAEFNRPRAARGAAQLLGKPVQQAVAQIFDNPAHWLTKRGDATSRSQSGLVAMALARMGANDAVPAATQLATKWEPVLGRELAAWTWAAIGKQAAMSQRPESLDAIEHAWLAWKSRKGSGVSSDAPDWGDDMLGWHARAALRFGTGAARWTGVQRATDAMSPTERADPTWVYWRARAALALAPAGAAGDAARAGARAELSSIAGPLTFYGLLAAEELAANAPALPARPAAPTAAERGQARANPGLRRALALVAQDLRDEARREWNYTLRGLSDRELLAAAQLACEAGDWQICINTSERSRTEVDVGQRYVMPYATDIIAAARSADVDPALVFGLIRQETRFMGRMASAVGASGLMQLMPPTAKWVARKSGIDYRPEQITDPNVNLRLGTIYLKMVLDSFNGSVPMAAAAYNAGPARPRRWRDGPVIEPAIWIENVPFAETRDYCKKVSTNYATYAALLSGRPAALKPRLGPAIGPRDASAPVPDVP